MRINPGDIDQLVGIEDTKSPIMELDYPIFSQIPEHPVDMDEGQARGISNVLLGQRKVHLFDLAARPLRAIPDE